MHRVKGGQLFILHKNEGNLLHSGFHVGAEAFSVLLQQSKNNMPDDAIHFVYGFELI